MIAPTVSTRVDVDALYRALLTPRAIEDKMLRLIRQGRISKWFSGYGQEAIAVGSAWALQEQDYILPMHRNLGVWTTRKVPLRRLLCQLFGREGAFTKGRDRTFHFGLPEQRIIGMISHMAAMLPVACGIGQALQYKQEDAVALAFCGDGGSREGDFHEALNLAAVWNLPVVFLVENNGYGLSTPTYEALAETEIVSMASGYNMPGRSVDGNDIFGVIEAVNNARETALRRGPVLLEMRTFRMRGHEEASGTAYVPDEKMDIWADRDPVARFEEYLRVAGGWSESDIEQVREEIAATVDDAVEWALDQPSIESTPDEEADAVYAVPSLDDAPPRATSLDDGTATAERRYIDAITDALDEAFAADDDLLMMGQDIAEYGGVFKVTDGFVDHYGPERIRNTPIIESGAIGAGLGLAIEGLRPVIEMQYADFISCGFNQIVNNLAKTHYRWGQPVNVTIRAPYGGGIGAGPFHSQSPEAWFAHVPGLKVVMPATPRDAKGLLHSALHDPNPTLFFEQKKLYRS
ncbi:MAG: thiamine pyrophosphate-dependent enzyme, partial [Longimonas sp.]|uniref:alpha-ketoacid dehydrogenase subunit alpha/beta n=1 Tax=Longimonas sp. TaxID=2039626 RepID=UPI003362161E